MPCKDVAPNDALHPGSRSLAAKLTYCQIVARFQTRKHQPALAPLLAAIASTMTVMSVPDCRHDSQLPNKLYPEI
jgi:hypothetical protein